MVRLCFFVVVARQLLFQYYAYFCYRSHRVLLDFACWYYSEVACRVAFAKANRVWYWVVHYVAKLTISVAESPLLVVGTNVE